MTEPRQDAGDRADDGPFFEDTEDAARKWLTENRLLTAPETTRVCHALLDYSNRLRMRVLAAPAPSEAGPVAEPCSGVAARWCPRCGDCTCVPANAVSRELFALDSPDCPLHGTHSEHAESSAPPAEGSGTEVTEALEESVDIAASEFAVEWCAAREHDGVIAGMHCDRCYREARHIMGLGVTAALAASRGRAP